MEVYNIKGLPMYGTINEPLFHMSDVETKLKHKFNHRNDFIPGIHFQVQFDNNIESIMFTENGLYKALFMVNTKESIYFQQFVGSILRELRLKGTVSLDEMRDLVSENTDMKEAVIELRLKNYKLLKDVEFATRPNYNNDDYYKDIINKLISAYSRKIYFDDYDDDHTEYDYKIYSTEKFEYKFLYLRKCIPIKKIKEMIPDTCTFNYIEELVWDLNTSDHANI